MLVNGLPSISANQRVQLRTDRDWFNCCIVYVTEVVPPKAICNSAGLVEKGIFEDDITVQTTDCDGCVEPVQVVELDMAADIKEFTAADIKEFTAGTEGPWFRLGIRCLGRIAPPSALATSRPGESGSLNPMQWIKSMLKARRKAPSPLPTSR